MQCLRCGSAVIYSAATGLCIECSQALDGAVLEAVELDADTASVILTTESSHDLRIAERLDIISAECVIGLHIFKDIANAFRDAFGGRSSSMQAALREARKTALAELRLEARDIGADAVVGVDLNYSEISGGGKSMLFLVASGTAVKLAKPAH